MEVKTQRGSMDERYQGVDRLVSVAAGEVAPLQAGVAPQSETAGVDRHRERGVELQRAEVQGMRQMTQGDFENLADRIFDPTSPDLAEAAEMIRYCGKLYRLYNDSLCVRCARAFSRPWNWLMIRVQ